MENKNEKTALLVMDVQPGIIDRQENKEAYISSVKKTISLAHKNNILVIFVVVGFRPKFPEISINNKLFNAMKDTSTVSMIDSHPVIEPEEGDILVVKHRISAFSGSDLGMILHSQDIKHIVLAGISTSGVVLSTLREAADKDFQITVLSDLCLDQDPEVHNVLMTKIFPRQAFVIDSKEWLV